MSVSTVIVLVGVVATFAAFASTLAWIQLQLRYPAIAGKATRPHRRRPF
jgi:hypothetical protein